MSEYVEPKQIAVAPGETVIINRCESPVEIGVGVVFWEDGDYIVSVHEGKITICRSGAFGIPHEVFTELIEEKKAEIERLKFVIANLESSNIDFERLKANPISIPKYIGLNCCTSELPKGEDNESE